MRVMVAARWVLVMAAMGGLLTACLGGDDDDGVGRGCATAARKLRSCGLLSAGEFDDCEEPDDELGRCRFRCALNATCDELRDNLCDDVDVPRVEACRDQCLVEHGFMCADGTFVRMEWRCDGIPDCGDTSDESGCEGPTFECANGSVVPASSVCSGFTDCGDGSDEIGCPTFQCSSGEIIALDMHCDGSVDCFDGSDEINDCPTFQCDDGMRLPISVECDGEAECADASDERGCPPVAVLTCG